MMKNFDIENLERKNIFTTPDNFFDKVQENVLKETVHQQKDIKITEAKPAKVFKLNWVYAAAAALAMIFGLGYFLNSNNTEFSVPNTVANVEQNKVVEKPSTPEVDPVQTIADLNKTGAVTEPSNQNLTLAQNDNPKNEARGQSRNIETGMAPKIVSTYSAPQNEAKMRVKTAAITAAAPDEALMDEVLSSFTYAELKEASKNTEQDVYLDLYN
ncbi:hypothetical protein [uncultured Chryseobacterium sp.]|mgnify:CR=1 FL=1|uniref:hypothetical protein n=1 Tax=uncultured Chryseobacterium sp. TaxID=259322 RepID=UPI0026032D73|nr:hypothetical protein [uncultured Chryseobacterium sp.]